MYEIFTYIILLGAHGKAMPCTCEAGFVAEALFSRFDHTGSGVLEATTKPGWKQSRAGEVPSGDLI